MDEGTKKVKRTLKEINDIGEQIIKATLQKKAGRPAKEQENGINEVDLIS